MSLEDLRAQAEKEEEVTEVEEPEAQDELEPEEAEDAETDEGSSDEEEGEETEGEPSEDFELELDGEPETGQQKPSPEDALVYKLTKQKAKAREYKSELEELKAEIAALKSGQAPQAQSRPQQPSQDVQLPPFPDMYDEGINGDRAKYDQAIKQWWVKSREAEQRNAQADQQKSDFKRQMEEMTLNMAKRVSKFATEHKMGSDYVANAVEKARQEVEDATGIDGSLAYMLDAVGEGSEKAAIWIGTEKGASDLTKIKQLLAEDKSGLKAIAHLTRIASRKPATNRTSKAPAPDRPVKGDGSPIGAAKKLQSEWDKAKTREEMMSVRRKAREAGVQLKT